MKTKVLFIVSDFYPGGAQREMYEIDNAIDKNKNILCTSDLKSSTYFPDFYYQKHLGLKSSIFFLLDIIKSRNLSFTERFKARKNKKRTYLLNSFLNNYDKVFYMGEYVFKGLEQYNTSFKKERINNIVIMSGRFQGEHYRDIDKNLKYHFISPFDNEEQVLHEFEHFKNFEHTYFPLIASIDESLNKWKFNEGTRKKKIGIFTRLSKAKPLDPFFYAFHLLLKEHEDVELHIFGAGDYKEVGYDRYINQLELSNVTFRGHQENISETLNNEKLDLVWFQGYLNRPAGYAGLDVIISGTPLLLWDFYIGENKNRNSIDYTYPMYKDLNLFVTDSKKVLDNFDLASNLAKKQYIDTVKTRGVNSHMETVKKLFS